MIMKAYNTPSCVEQLEITLVQAPIEINGNRAICSVRATLSNGKRFADIGDAIETTPPETQSSIVKAAAKALERVMTHIAGNGGASSSTPWDNGDGEDMFSCPQPKPSRKSGGGGNKPISEGQIKFIASLCSKQGKDSEIMELFDKPLGSLKGTDADNFIKILIGKNND